MRILYDYQILISQRYGGVSRYFFEIASRISKKANCEVDVPVIFFRNYYFEKYFNRKSIAEYPNKTGFLVKNLNKLNIKRKNKNKYDIIHPTYFDPYIINKFSGKLVITVYDMIHEIYPELFIISDKTTMQNKKEMILAADKIIAISENTKRDILKFYPQIDPKIISVIYLGNSLTPKTNSAKIEVPIKYILYVGTRNSYKNFNSFVKAFAKISNDQNNLQLVCAGGGKFNDEELTLLKELGIEERVKQQSFSDDELAQAYSQAVCFVFPSKYEGFGIPVLEAFACKCPTLLSNRSSLPEVGGDAALYFDPDDLDDMANQMERVLNDKELSNQLIELGQERLKLFNWDKIAGQTLELYKSIL